MMTGKILVRLVGALTCVAAVVAGWDAEAGHRHRRHACCEPVCCEPVCTAPCEPVCETAYAPRYVRYYDSCSCCWRTGWTYTVVSRPAACCEGVVIAAASTTPAAAETTSVVAARPASTSSPAATPTK